MFTLRPYQQALTDQIYAHWAGGFRNVLAALPTGGGKAVIVCYIMSKHNGASCIIAHRQELVGQLCLTLAQFGVRHRIIGPKSLIQMAVQVQMDELGASFYDPSAACGVAGVDTLIRRQEPLTAWANSVTLVVQDECFVASTLVDGHPIEDHKVGDVITGFDETTGKFGQYPVTHVFKNPTPGTLVKVTLSTHHSLYVTKGHPFWTRRGWVPAGELTVNDEVLTNEMFALRYTNYEPVILPTESGEKRPLDLLHPNMRGVGEQSRPLRHDGKDQSQVCVSSNEETQPHVEPRYRSKNGGDVKTDRALPKTTRRKRQRPNGSGNETKENSATIWDAVLEPCGENEKTVPFRMASPLQNRCGNPDPKDSVGGGRGEPQPSHPSRVGPEERRVFKWFRVGSVEVLQSDDPEVPGDGYVYNLEVDKVHTYTANGVVVHNCHHVLMKSSTGKPNKWGTAQRMFPNAWGLGVTATPGRADGRGLGAHTDGFYDCLVQGLTMRELIDLGALSDYRIFAPPSDLDLTRVKTNDTTGDYVKNQLSKEIRRSHLMGDVVEHYLKIAPGKRGIVFAADVATAVEIAGRFQAAKVRAEVVSAKTPDRLRHELIRRFRNGELDILTNVDLFGEGFDLPALEVVMMTRPTQSYAVFSQQFGRACRPKPNGQRAIIIDPVGNTMRHGLPDAKRTWTLDRRERGAQRKRDPDVMPITTCTSCFSPYEAIYKACPFCGEVPVPAGRSRPIQVDGDLFELDATTLATMRGEIAKVNLSENEMRRWLGGQNMSHAVKGNILKNHLNRQDAQVPLRDAIAWWAGWQRHMGRPDSESYRRFFHSFGVDVATAQTLGKNDATALADKVWRTMS